MPILIADSGSTKCEWCLVSEKENEHFFTQGMSPYFLNPRQLREVIDTELLPKLQGTIPSSVFFYGTGCKDPNNAKKVLDVLSDVFEKAKINVTHDLMGAARALCQHSPGIACILGTGSNSCSFDGEKIIKNSPGLGYALGDEGSGAYLGIRIIQHYCYRIFDTELSEKFDREFNATADDILENVYSRPLPNRYLASFSIFLSQNRGHYIIENILEDGIRDFFDNHVIRYGVEPGTPVHFTGGIAWYFSDIVKNLCELYGLSAGTILKNPMEGLINYHHKDIR
jgi:glucosamine kinase